MTPQVLEEVFSLKACIGREPWIGKPLCITYELQEEEVS